MKFQSYREPLPSSFPEHGDRNTPVMGLTPMLESEDSLPCPQRHPPPVDGDHLGRTGQSHADVAWHVIRPFVSVDEIRIILRDQAIEPSLEITPCAWVGVFHEDQTRAGVAEENRHLSRGDSGSRDDTRNLIGNLISSFTAGSEREFVSMYFHRSVGMEIGERRGGSGI